MFKRQLDLRSEPVRRIVALGESTTWGYSVSEKSRCWVNQVAGLLEEFQGSEIELINQGIGSNVLTPECPSYAASAKPSALERVDADLIAHNPDMVFLSYGLNDSRGGTPPETFRRAYQQLIDRIRARIQPTIVLLNTYYMHEFFYKNCEHWEESSYELTEVYNLVIQQIAEGKLPHPGGYLHRRGRCGLDHRSGPLPPERPGSPDHCQPRIRVHRAQLQLRGAADAIGNPDPFICREVWQRSGSAIEVWGTPPSEVRTRIHSRDWKPVKIE